ncbi:MAG: hypothetical protein OEY01_07870 [Desulfobulbaceae bacterium]|nr:hypothetical protein [Desulfobulbaceae bacterium]HIJ78973.1 hypothetical protein [Deltaproteobacteria bacterium]
MILQNSKILVCVILISVLILLSGCSSKYVGESVDSSEVIGKKMFLKTNLHADRGTGHLSSVNYQVIGKLIKWGSPVIISEEKVSDDALLDFVLKEIEANENHNFFFHGRTLRYETPYSYLKKILTEDPAELERTIAGLSAIDQQGIEKGIVLVGMSKIGVRVALGDPPVFANPDPKTAVIWHYWYNKRGQFKVAFDEGGMVKEITGFYPVR